MSRYGIGLIVLACVVFAGATISRLQQRCRNGFSTQLSDKERGRIFDGVMRIRMRQSPEMAAPEVADSLPERSQLPTTSSVRFR